jgi:hypothetical protein
MSSMPTTDRLHALVVYESMFGNTEAVAHAIAGGLRAGGCTVEVTDVASAPQAIGLDVDLLVIGAPTHAFSLSRPKTRADAVRQGASPERATTGIREWLEGARPRTNGAAVALFDTRVTKARRLPAAASKSAKLARRRGFQLADKPAAFLVHDVTGPLEPGELDRALTWGRELAHLCTTRTL